MERNQPARSKPAGTKTPAGSKTKAQIDPELSKALRQAGDNGMVEAVLMFQRPKAATAAEQTSQLKRDIRNASDGDKVEANYFPNLGSVAVRGKGRAVKKLLRHPGLTVAALNRG